MIDLIESSPIREPLVDDLETIFRYRAVLTDEGRNALAELCAHCGLGPIEWCERLCLNCASLTDQEVIEYGKTGHHPRLRAADAAADDGDRP